MRNPFNLEEADTNKKLEKVTLIFGIPALIIYLLGGIAIGKLLLIVSLMGGILGPFVIGIPFLALYWLPLLILYTLYTKKRYFLALFVIFLLYIPGFFILKLLQHQESTHL